MIYDSRKVGKLNVIELLTLNLAQKKNDLISKSYIQIKIDCPTQTLYIDFS